jgi:hypothetical protein
MPRRVTFGLLAGCLLSAVGVPAFAQEPDAPVMDEATLDAALAGGAVAQPSGPQLSLYGFASLAYQQMLEGSSNPWRQVIADHPSFVMGNLNLYLDADIAERWRSLMEVRFLYVPHGSETLRSDLSFSVEDTTVRDPAEFGHSIRWAGIMIERAWLEYQAHDLVNIRAGHFLTPYGIWNVDHGAPVVLGIWRPFIIRDALFPERQTGLELYGAKMLGRVRWGYHLTLSNGRGPAPDTRDSNDNKAVGGRLHAQFRSSFELALGISGTMGRSKTPRFRWVPAGNGSAARQKTLVRESDDGAVGVDLRLQAGPLLVQSEIIAARRLYTDQGREAAVGMPGLHYPDARRWGVYGLIAYRTPWWGITPYFTGEYYRPTEPGDLTAVFGRLNTIIFAYTGINVRPVPHVVLKLELTHGRFPDAAPGTWGQHDVNLLQAEASWVF